MKKNQGFTLIELLAVVVILAIVALISVPLIMNVIDGARKGALQNTAYGIAEAGKYAFTNEVIKDGSASFTAYTYENGVETSSPAGKSLSYKGEKPKTGTILINSKGDIAMSVYNGKYCAEKGFDDVEVTVSEKTETDCKLVEALTEVEVLVVAGGGSGGTSTGAHQPGGGGAGGLLHQQVYSVTAGTPITIVVGNGGNSVLGAVHTPGNNGQNSVFGTLTAIGGGGGAGGTAGPAKIGGSGGGGHYQSTPTTGAAGTTGQGNKGGDSLAQSVGNYGGGGGGGAGEPGYTNLAGPRKQEGGNGLNFSDILGTSIGDDGWLAGGGGSGENGTFSAPGGKGGGGHAADTGTSDGYPGIPNTGGGGGSSRAGTSGAGGSGIVIVRYFGVQRANGGAVTMVGDYTIHTFTTGTATFEPLEV